MDRNAKSALLRVTGLLIAVIAAASPLLVFGQDPVERAKREGAILLLAAQPDQAKEDKKDKIDTPSANVPPPSLPEPPTTKELGTPPASASGTTTQTTPGSSTFTPPAVPTGGDVGSVLGNSTTGTGVDVQRRSPLSSDPRIDGYHVGQIVSYADGAFWTPARIDLDTALGKINPDNIDNIQVIKGPYSVRYGPGFAFLDITTLPTPRSTTDCFEGHGSTSLLYKTNGDALSGRQSLWGGGSDWGFRLSYDIMTGSDYHEGGGTTIPSAYNSQNVDFAIGFDLSKDSHFEFKYMRQMQHGVDYPGLLTDIDQQNTDGLTARYVLENTGMFDKLTMDVWYNTTSFNGNSANPSTRGQIPELNAILMTPANSPNNPNNTVNNSYFNNGGTQIRLDLDTQARLSTWGTREAMTWGQDKGVQVTAGLDFVMIRQQYNEFDSFNFSPPNNFGIPATQSIDSGLFADGALPIGDRLTLRTGGRIDFVNTDLLYLGAGMNNNNDYVGVLGPDVNATQHNLLGSAFATAEYKLTDHWTWSDGYGFAQRAPMLTELYSGGAFFGLIQNGFNAIYGNPDLSPEQLNQFDISLKAKYDDFRAGAHGFFSMVNNYITYERIGTANGGTGNFEIAPGSAQPLVTVLNQYQFKNTRLATLTGFDLFGELDLTCWLTPFVTMSYVRAQDQEIDEPLPGIPPLESRVGFRVHDADKSPRWAVEFTARMVAGQDEVATSLGEMPTGGFTVFNIRGFWQIHDQVLLTAGVDNVADRNYQEHLDLRTGLGVYQPGINFYFGMKVTY